MKFVLTILCLASLLTSCQLSDKNKETIMNTAYNENLAKSVNADDYGMKKYVMAFLKAGPNRDQSQEEAIALQKAHMDNISRLAEEGKLIVAGPFLDDGELRGIYIFDVEDIESARALTESDPAIQAGSLVMELKPWYGSASLMLVKDYHDKLKKKDF
ncbi:MAG: YciI family protein [Chitinophagales bacterium]